MSADYCTIYQLPNYLSDATQASAHNARFPSFRHIAIRFVEGNSRHEALSRLWLLQQELLGVGITVRLKQTPASRMCRSCASESRGWISR
jgi:hypothetical protein